MRSALIVGAVAIAAGLGLSVWASHEARRADVPPLACGLAIFAPPAGSKPPAPPTAGADAATAPAADGATATGTDGATAPAADGATASAAAFPNPEARIPNPVVSEKPPDLETLFGSLSPDDLAAAGRALEPFRPPATLPIRLLFAVAPVSSSAWFPLRSFGVAVVDDADADRILAPLASSGPGGAAVYAADGVPVADLLSDNRFPPGAADVPAARLPASARCLRDMILVRRSAAARLGLAPRSPAPNALIASLARPDDLESAVAAAWPLWKDRGLSPRPVDLPVAPDSAAWWLASSALAMILAGGSLLLAAALAVLARAGNVRNAVLARFLAGVRIVDRNRREFAAILAIMTAAIVVGAAWGGPPMLGDVLRENAAGPLARIGLRSADLGPTGLAELFILALLVTLLLYALVLIGVPSLVPGLGLATALARNLVWGLFLAPAALTFVDRLPLRATAAAVEGLAYAVMALGAWRVLAGVLWPGAMGLRTRREGYAAGTEDLYRLIPLAAAILAAAALVETAFVALAARLG